MYNKDIHNPNFPFTIHARPTYTRKTSQVWETQSVSIWWDGNRGKKSTVNTINLKANDPSNWTQTFYNYWKVESTETQLTTSGLPSNSTEAMLVHHQPFDWTIPISHVMDVVAYHNGKRQIETDPGYEIQRQFWVIVQVLFLLWVHSYQNHSLYQQTSLIVTIFFPLANK